MALLLGGAQYANAEIPLMIMALYPIHQTYGQVLGSLFMATGKTKLLSFLGLISLIIGFIIVYFSFAPHRLGSFNGGAIGLAINLSQPNLSHLISTFSSRQKT